MPDHLHLLIGTKPNCNLSDLVRDIKTNSTKWIAEKEFIKKKLNGKEVLEHLRLVILNYPRL